MQYRSDHPTVVVFGTPETEAQEKLIKELRQNGFVPAVTEPGERDPVFSYTGILSIAHAVVLFPNAHPFQLIGTKAEREVGDPFLMNDIHAPLENPSSYKPIIYFGNESEWQPYRAAFSTLTKKGLVRPAMLGAELREKVLFSDERDTVLNYINDRLPHGVDKNRQLQLSHSRRPGVTSIERSSEHIDLNHPIIAFFCSASAKAQEFYERTDRVLDGCAERGYIVLHGGASVGLMNYLSVAGKALGLKIIGVTVDDSGALLLAYEKEQGSGRPKDVDMFIASRSMVMRIEDYLRANAVVALDGGFGSAHEIAMCAQLRYQRHAAMLDVHRDGSSAFLKPLIALDESGIWAPLVEYFRRSGFGHLADQVELSPTVEAMHASLDRHFELHPTRALRSLISDPRDSYEERYGLPLLEVDLARELSLPDLGNLAPEPERNITPGLQP